MKHHSYSKMWLLLVLTCMVMASAAVKPCKYGPGCQFSCHCMDLEPCDPLTGFCPNGCDDGKTYVGIESGRWFGQGCQVGNVAFNKTATQLGLYGYNYASNAIDGKVKTCAVPSSKVAFTDDDDKYLEPVWWTVDLKGMFNIVKVTIEFREGSELRITNTSIFVGTDPKSPSSMTLCGFIDDKSNLFNKPSNRISKWCKNKTNGRYVTIQRSEHGYQPFSMALCEVSILGSQIDMNSNAFASNTKKWLPIIATLSVVAVLLLLVVMIMLIVGYHMKSNKGKSENNNVADDETPDAQTYPPDEPEYREYVNWQIPTPNQFQSII